MKKTVTFGAALLLGLLDRFAAEPEKSAADAKPPSTAAAPAQVRYPVDPDSLPAGRRAKRKTGRAEFISEQDFHQHGPPVLDFRSGTIPPDKPACVLVFQDGQRATRTNGSLRVPQVMENLIAKKQMPVTIGIFITPGSRGEEYAEVGGGNPNNRSVEYDSLGDQYARFIVEEMLPEVGKKYNLTKDPEGRAIGGTSSGAICAFNVAWERPDEFHKVSYNRLKRTYETTEGHQVADSRCGRGIVRRARSRPRFHSRHHQEGEGQTSLPSTIISEARKI